MATKQLANAQDTCQVHLAREGQWARMTLSLGGAFVGGKLVEMASNSTSTLQGNDEVTASYTVVNWLSGIASGALYAFRSLNIPRRRVLVENLEGVLGEAGMDALASAAAVGVARLSGREAPHHDSDGWHVECEVSEPGQCVGVPEENGQPGT